MREANSQFPFPTLGSPGEGHAGRGWRRESTNSASRDLWELAQKIRDTVSAESQQRQTCISQVLI